MLVSTVEKNNNKAMKQNRIQVQNKQSQKQAQTVDPLVKVTNKIKQITSAYMHYKATVLTALIIILLSNHAYAARIRLVDDAPPRNTLTEYEKKHVYKKAAHPIDPHIWVYTSKFAKKYGMPKKWINDDLKGAEALAYKKYYYNQQSCGFNGSQASCIRDYRCQLDIFMDAKDSAKLPWVNDLQFGRRSFAGYGDAGFFIGAIMDKDERKQFRKNRGRKWGVDSVLKNTFVEEGASNYRSSAGMIFFEYRKQIYPNIDLLSTKISCFFMNRDANLKHRIYFTYRGDTWTYIKKNKFYHYVNIPMKFHDEMKAYNEKNSKNDLWSIVTEHRKKGNK